MEVNDLNLEVADIVRLVWSCLNGELYFLWRLSQMSLKGKMSNVCERSFGMVMQANYLMEFLFNGSCLGKVTGPTKEVVMFEMVVGWLRWWIWLI